MTESMAVNLFHPAAPEDQENYVLRALKT
jgi:hypothetical protein